MEHDKKNCIRVDKSFYALFLKLYEILAFPWLAIAVCNAIAVYVVFSDIDNFIDGFVLVLVVVLAMLMIVYLYNIKLSLDDSYFYCRGRLGKHKIPFADIIEVRLTDSPANLTIRTADKTITIPTHFFPNGINDFVNILNKKVKKYHADTDLFPGD